MRPIFGIAQRPPWNEICNQSGARSTEELMATKKQASTEKSAKKKEPAKKAGLRKSTG
jgi:hypothetical protein